MASPRCQVTAVHTFLVIAPEIASEMPSEIMDLSGQHKKINAVFCHVCFLLGQIQCGRVRVRGGTKGLLSGSIQMTAQLMCGNRGINVKEHISLSREMRWDRPKAGNSLRSFVGRQQWKTVNQTMIKRLLVNLHSRLLSFRLQSSLRCLDAFQWPLFENIQAVVVGWFHQGPDV